MRCLQTSKPIAPHETAYPYMLTSNGTGER